MANPKRRHSKARTRRRRTRYYNSIKNPELMECNNCGTPKMYHRACPSCGFYRGRKVIEPVELV